MKEFVIFLLAFLVLLLLTPFLALADPWLVCDPQLGVTQYKINIGDHEYITTAEPDGSLKFDLEQLPTGDYTACEVRAGTEYHLNGEPTGGRVWSEPLPFELLKPLRVAPVGLGIVP